MWTTNHRRLIIEQFDPERPKPGGIDTCIRGIVAFAPPGVEILIAGVDATGTKTLGEWGDYEIGGRPVRFMPVARLDHANLRRRVPHSVRLTRGVRRFRPAPDADVVQAHRINVGAAVLSLYPRARHVQFVHSSGSANLGKGSKSFFRRAAFVYRALERYLIPRMDDVVVFSKDGAERMSQFARRVRFSPTWYDNTEFFPADAAVPWPGTRLLWACRIEPAKNPQLAIDTLALLPLEYGLTVAGSGTLAVEMLVRAQRAGLESRVRFLGAVDKGSMGALMREHDLLLMTSRFEGFSRSIVEALASGLPVITTAGGEPNGLVVEGLNGTRVDDDDARQLAAAVLRARQISPAAARSSVRLLGAAVVVPSVLGLDPLPGFGPA